MTATITIDMDNAAFDGQNGEELARILRDLADDFDGPVHVGDSLRLKDYNGNFVGSIVITENGE